MKNDFAYPVFQFVFFLYLFNSKIDLGVCVCDCASFYNNLNCSLWTFPVYLQLLQQVFLSLLDVAIEKVRGENPRMQFQGADKALAC